MTNINDVTVILSKLPDNPGIYLFFDTKKELIYVGKATSLKSRVSSYFRGARSMRPIEQMMHEVSDIKWKETDSVLEAIILEAQYIKKFQPKYNVDGKDDKSWNYIVIDKEKFSGVKTMRERELQKDDVNNYKYVFGPYPGLNTKVAMKLLRRIFKFSECKPGNGRPCLYRQMGQCLGSCEGEISAVDYRKKVINPLVIFLSGKKKNLIKILEREMNRAGKAENFEEAARLRDQLKSLERIQDIALLNKSFVDGLSVIATCPERRSNLLAKGSSPRPFGARDDAVGMRIEGYDISNIGATEKVGSMVVFNQDGPVKSDYRKFIIRSVVGQSDIDCLAEVLERRLKRVDWPMPDLILVDGGVSQVNKAKQILGSLGMEIPSVGIAKGPKRKRNDVVLGDKSPEFIAWVSQNKDLLIRVRDEAHRFAISFHRQRRGKMPV